MNIEKIFYYYERTRKQQAKVLAFNMLFLPFVLWLFLNLVPESEPVYKTFSVCVKYILVIGELALLSIIIWFLTHPEKFYIKLTSNEFSSYHPTCKEWTFSVNPQNIIEIEHSTDRDARHSYISVKINNGSSFLLSPNFAYNRKNLYEALRLVNPKIIIPKHTWLFSSKR